MHFGIDLICTQQKVHIAHTYTHKQISMSVALSVKLNAALLKLFLFCLSRVFWQLQRLARRLCALCARSCNAMLLCVLVCMRAVILSAAKFALLLHFGIFAYKLWQANFLLAAVGFILHVNDLENKFFYCTTNVIFVYKAK